MYATPPNESAKAWLLTLLFNTGGLGYLYHISFLKKDHISIRSTIYLVYGLETTQTAMLCWSAFRSFVYGFLDANSFDVVGSLWLSVPVIGALVAFIVQLFYAYRIIRLSRFMTDYRVLAVSFIVVMLSLAQLGAGITLGLELRKVAHFSLVHTPGIRIPTGLWYIGESLSDVVIAVSMTYILLQVEDIALQGTRRLTRKIIRLTVESGTLTATMAIITVILAVIKGNNTSYYQTSAGIVSKLYSNTFLASMNSRLLLGAQDLDLNLDRRQASPDSPVSFGFINPDASIDVA